MSIMDAGMLALMVTQRQQDSAMSFFAWIVLGLIAGYVGSKLVNRTGEGLIRDVLLGIVGAIVGGFLFNLFGAPGVTGIHLYSLLVAGVRAGILFGILFAIFPPTRF